MPQVCHESISQFIAKTLGALAFIVTISVVLDVQLYFGFYRHDFSHVGGSAQSALSVHKEALGFSALQATAGFLPVRG